MIRLLPPIFLLLLLLLCNLLSCGSQVHHNLDADVKILLGAFLGEVSVIRSGIYRFGEINAILDGPTGANYLKLGVPQVDFPTCPALHMAISQGGKAHFEAAVFLVNNGANINFYMLPGPDVNAPSFPPAILFSLGLGPKPRNTHAAMLSRFKLQYPDKFQLHDLEEWRRASGNPPILQLALMNNFFDGVYVLVTNFNASVNERDAHGVSALHIAAWKGDIFALAFLLHEGADRTATDVRGRTALHYAALRGCGPAITSLLEAPAGLSMGQGRTFKRKYLAVTDHDGRTALMAAALSPPLTTAVRAIRREMTELQLLPPGRWNKPPKNDIKNRGIFDPEPGDSEGWRGGWLHQHRDGNNPLWNQARGVQKGPDYSDVDVVRAADLGHEAFVRDYFSAQRPVLLGGQPMAGRGVWAHWRRPEFLARYGGLQVLLPAASPRSVADWVDGSMCGAPAGQGIGCEAAAQSNPWVAIARIRPPNGSGPSLHADFKRSTLFELCSQESFLPQSSAKYVATPQQRATFAPHVGRDEEDLLMALGPSGSGIPLQSHNASWELLVTGRVHWFLIAPGQAQNATTGEQISPSPSKRDGEVEGAELKEAMGEEAPPTQGLFTPVEWIVKVAPALRSRGVLFEVTQHPGEVLFIPHGWLHLWWCDLGDCVSVSQEFCTAVNTDHRTHPLGAMVYAGRDDFRGLGKFNTLRSRARKERRPEEGVAVADGDGLGSDLDPRTRRDVTGVPVRGPSVVSSGPPSSSLQELEIEVI